MVDVKRKLTEKQRARRMALGQAFFTIARARYGNKFDYSRAKYKGSQTHLTILCPDHGEFQQVPAEHLRSKYGCPHCAGNARYTHEEFVAQKHKLSYVTWVRQV